MSKKYVIGVTGEKGKGKTTFVHVLNYLLSINGYPATVVNFADYIKQVARDCFGRDIGRIHGKLSQHDRELLCKIGDALRSIDANCLVNVVDREIRRSSGFIIVGDVRLTHEADMIHKYKGIVVRMESAVFNRNENYLRDHVTEKQVSKIKPDICIVNEGTVNDLVSQGKRVLCHFMPRKRWKS